MDWQQLITQLGGSAFFIGGAAWVVKALANRVLDRDLESFKSGLSSTAQTEIERVKHQLQLAALEHQIRFSKLHESRAAVISKIYIALVDAIRSAEAFTTPLGYASDPPMGERFITANNKFVDLFLELESNRIYLPEDVCDQLETFVRNCRTQLVKLGTYVQFEHLPGAERQALEKHKAWFSADDYFKTEAKISRRNLEAVFRDIMSGSPIEVAGASEVS